MTKRTLAANAAASTFDIHPSRRMLLAGTAATIATAGTPALAANFDADAPLLLLRSRWIEAQAAHQTALDAHTPFEAAFFDQCPPFPEPSFDAGYPAALARVQAARDKLRMSLGLDKAEEACDAASDAFCTILDEIVETPARTLAGLAFKVQASEVEEHLLPALVSSVMTDIAAFAAAHPTVRI